ncbi:hypothetical protein CAEBREN_15041 [Caenorhabditis brenneri]|uniref:Uncharacterized protein n=1 Tax=Caenorhabditis brenneri TaxID=135651 RepID=G0N6S5_CAEBE|nr:hypothetical protein CAEBREN_15041 [Caenorhabditis brenneri]
MGIADLEDFNVCVTTLFIHGCHYFHATLTREPFEVAPLEPGTENYQWVDDHFERYGEEPPLPMNPCPGYPHDHVSIYKISLSDLNIVV